MVICKSKNLCFDNEWGSHKNSHHYDEFVHGHELDLLITLVALIVCFVPQAGLKLETIDALMRISLTRIPINEIDEDNVIPL